MNILQSTIQDTINTAEQVITQAKRLSTWRDAAERDLLMNKAIALLHAALDAQERLIKPTY